MIGESAREDVFDEESGGFGVEFDFEAEGELKLLLVRLGARRK